MEEIVLAGVVVVAAAEVIAVGHLFGTTGLAAFLALVCGLSLWLVRK